MEKKYQIFISSTFEDLKEERQKVRDAILKLYHFPIGMEMFSANDDEQWEEIKRTIETSDYYIIIIGHRYGSLTDEGISYTEKEYDYAVSLNIPVLAFIQNRNIPIANDKRENNTEKNKKLGSFIKKASKKMRTEWNSGEDLAKEVVISISQALNKYKRPGWVRSDQHDVEGLLFKHIELTEKINHLIEENNKLKSLQQTKKPEIVVKLNENKELTIDNFLSFSDIKMDLKELSVEDIPDYLNDVVTEKMINEYNVNLPDIDIREDYEKKLVLYNKINNTGLDLNISVVNDGNTKANDICIDIIFPEQLLIKEITKINNLQEPRSPKMPVNPIKKAEKEYYKKIHPNLAAIASFAQNFHTYDGILNPQITSRLSLPNFETDCFVSDNEISIRLNDLLHTRMRNFNDRFRIIPLEKGNYELLVNIMCEEYEENIEFTVPVIIN